MSESTLLVLSALLLPFLVQAVKFVAEKVFKKPFTGNVLRILVFGVCLGIGYFAYVLSGNLFPTLPVVSEDPSVFAGGLVTFLTQWIIVLTAVYQIATKFYDKLLGPVLDKFGFR